MPSLASDRFFDELKGQLETLARYLYNGPHKDRIMGLFIGYPMMGELFYQAFAIRYYDFSEVNRRRFARWLAAEYDDDVQRLNEAWGASLAAFTDARIPPASEWEAGDDGLFGIPCGAVPSSTTCAITTSLSSIA